ncbi:helix-turn-helix transcriptional regulator [Mycobacterium sp. CVI_P3]|uniref:Helix-turn-helix transcriptional regulator n=1 Tax=Mycobacterium pinniadriaticum TaxID=2994102 RepID=A0ABT3SNX8_9MYCO|nr:helix-turn-helix transcriptional regulator [Mycobacterium pinniadriaticum]MCX2934070.1 helix-turn-helix transcriptional regulator [Mycobacterium pinniadriaticum]MCX2940492.1 helix-turn-helix transcriptional regulator [Mycobacterium pinniadriaticum]
MLNPTTTLTECTRSTVEDHARREALAEFLRTRRESLQPEDIGIPRRGRRRVKGLRRHEVADAAAVSVTWYTWLEQGRDIHATPQVIEALARALQLDNSEHSYLCRLAGVPKAIQFSRPHVDDSLITLVDSLSPHPAQLMLPATDLITWNRAYARLFVDPSTLAPEDRNALWIQVMCPEVRDRLVDWEAETQLATGRFRAEAAKYPGDPHFSRVVDKLTSQSGLFGRIWDRHEVQGLEDDVKTIQHPEVGVVRLRLIKLRPLDHPQLLLMVYMLADDESRVRMGQLLDLS